jgi:hypothetical protein
MSLLCRGEAAAVSFRPTVRLQLTSREALI